LSSAIRMFVLDFYRDLVAEYEKRDKTREMLATAAARIADQGH